MVRDPRERGDVRGYRTLGIDEGLKLLDNLAAHNPHGANFRNGIQLGIRSGGLEVDDNELDIDELRAKILECPLRSPSDGAVRLTSSCKCGR
ncbi:hypothetical protein ACUXOQ_000783 [Dermabacter hominis]